VAVGRAEIADFKGMVAALSARVATLARLLFGEKTEKHKRRGPDPGDGDEGRYRSLPADDTEGRRGQKPGSEGHGRRDCSDVETDGHVHDVPEDERVCPDCGTGYERFGEETSEQIDWRVRIVRIVHRRPVYRRRCHCPVRGALLVTVPAKPIPKGLFAALFLARLVVENFVLGRHSSVSSPRLERMGSTSRRAPW
jgi:hypothetical protein